MERKTKEEIIRDFLQSIRSNAYLLRYAETVQDCDNALASIDSAIEEIAKVLSTGV